MFQQKSRRQGARKQHDPGSDPGGERQGMQTRQGGGKPSLPPPIPSAAAVVPQNGILKPGGSFSPPIRALVCSAVYASIFDLASL